MLFNSYIFILLFLPIVLIGYFLLNHYWKYTWANLFLILMSLWFYGYYNPKYLLVICGSILFNYTIAYSMNHISFSCNGQRRVLLAFGILVNGTSIFYFKYFNFFVENINGIFRTSVPIRNIVLPLGISFFTFQQISYLVDSYRGQTKDYRFMEYVLFVVFFPQLVAGPILLHNEMIPQFRDVSRRKINYYNMSKGFYIFVIGLFKKVMIADTLSRAVSFGYGTVEDLSCVEAFIVSLSYTLQLYFDFSGYCDIASGIACMMNISLPQNFNSPYRAMSIVDFWNRWHMSLTRFLREYVYFPLGGSKVGKARMYLNIMAVFLVSGIWHGANWTFIVWGLLHGILNCINRLTKKVWEKIPQMIQWTVNFLIVNALWVMFRAKSIGQAMTFYKRMFCFHSLAVREELADCFNLKEFTFFLPERVFGVSTNYGMMILILILVLTLSVKAKNSSEIVFKETKGRAVITVLLLVWSIFSLSGLSEFLYFGF